MAGVNRKLVAFAFGAALALVASPAAAVRIGIFFDREGTSCNAQVPINTSGTCYLLAILDAPPEDGIVGAEFGVSGFPSGWPVTFNSSSAAGWDLFSTQGVTVTFRSCQRGTRRIVELGSFSFFATTQASATLQVVAPTQSSHQGLSCPSVALCDSSDQCAPGLLVPEYSLECVEGLSATINGDPCAVDALMPGLVAQLAVWPNPTRGTTTLSFSLARNGAVELQVFDVAGRKVRTLHAGSAVSGSHSLLWDGRDDAARPLPSGIYFVRFLSPGRPLQTQRLTLLR